jgi:hypothetical protein
MDRVHHVGAERLLPGFRGVTDRQRADVADEDIDSAEFGGRAIDPLLQRRGVGDVGRLTPSLDALALQRLDDAFDLLRLPRANRDIGAFGCEQIRDRPADSLGPPVTRAFLSFSPRSMLRSSVEMPRYAACSTEIAAALNMRVNPQPS